MTFYALYRSERILFISFLIIWAVLSTYRFILSNNVPWPFEYAVPVVWVIIALLGPFNTRFVLTKDSVTKEFIYFGKTICSKVATYNKFYGIKLGMHEGQKSVVIKSKKSILFDVYLRLPKVTNRHTLAKEIAVLSKLPVLKK